MVPYLLYEVLLHTRPHIDYFKNLTDAKSAYDLRDTVLRSFRAAFAPKKKVVGTFGCMSMMVFFCFLSSQAP